MSRAVGATVRGGEADPVPGRLRAMLEGSRRKGLAFPLAWHNAVEYANPPVDWTERQVNGLGADRISPLEFAKHVFARAYARIPLTGDVTALADGDRPKAVTPKPGAVRGAPRCAWGRPSCDRDPMVGGRFCGEHEAYLGEIRAGLEQSDAANSKQAMPNRGVKRRADSLPTFSDSLDLLGAQASVLG